MKANEAPEKIYFSSTEDGTHYYTEDIPFEREYIEYVRKDVILDWSKARIATKKTILEQAVVQATIEKIESL